jgi:transglutaminase-like putative cysteine protease
MRKLSRLLILGILITILLSGSTYASTQKYIVTKEMIFENQHDYIIKNGFVEVMIGKSDLVQYQKDNDLNITPEPDKIDEDEYGNIYARYEIKNYTPGQQLKVVITKDIEVSTYEKEIPNDTNTEINDDNKLFLEPQTRVESDNSEIIEKAEELTKGKTSDYKKAQAIYEFVNLELTYDTDDKYSNKGALSALRNKRGVCEEYATLFVALCRAENIPARLIEGYRLDNDKKDEKGNIEAVNHVWPEVYLKDYGWVPVEPTVLYLYNGEKKLYENGYAKLVDSGYAAIGVYNYDRASRTMYLIDEISYSETVAGKVEIPERNFGFTDISPEYDWSLSSIKNLYNLNIINGYDDKEYKPQNSITRIEFIAMLSRVLTNLSTPSVGGGKIYYYPEYDLEHWSKGDYDNLMRFYQAATPSDIVSYGYTNLASVFDDKLDMNKPITRAEVVALMEAFLNKPVDVNVFSDVEGHRFAKSILKSYSNDLIVGYPDGTFKPDNKITRAEIAVVFDRYINSKKFTVNQPEKVEEDV